MATADVLRAARARIEDPKNWCQHRIAMNRDGESVDPRFDDACSWCAYGAIFAEGFTYRSGAAQYLRSAARTEFHDSEPDIVNDGIGHAAVLRMFDVAIAAAEAEAR